MRKKSVDGPLEITPTNIVGDSFQGKAFHGTPDSVVYAFGRPSALRYMHMLGKTEYTPGALGENLTLESFEESEVFIGDVFEVGKVRLQCTFPRIPCPKVNIRMQNTEALSLMRQFGRSGAYFRVLTPGSLFIENAFTRVEVSHHRLPLTEVYKKVANKESFSRDEINYFLENPFLPQGFREKLSQLKS